MVSGGDGRRADPHRQFVPVQLDPERRARGDLAGDLRAGNPRLQLALQKALERPRAEDRIEAGAGDVRNRHRRNLQCQSALCEPLPQLLATQADDLLDLCQRQRPEQHDLIDAIEEFGPEVRPQLAHHPVARHLGQAVEQVR